MKFGREAVLIVIGLLVLAMSVFGVPSAPSGQGTSITEGTPETYSQDYGNTTATGGNMTYLNVSAVDISTKWQVFYGDVTSSLSLRDGSNNVAYSWADSTPTGEVFFANSSTVNWVNLSGNGVASSREAENAALTLGSANDNMTNTFSAATTHPLINFTGLNTVIAADATYAVKTNNGTGDAAWSTALTWDDANVKVYTGFINQTTTAFNNVAANYQVMVPIDTVTHSRLYTVFVAIE